MHACWAKFSWKPVAVRKKCMHAHMPGHPSAGSRLHLRKKCGKIEGKLNMYACMLEHLSDGSRLHLRKNTKKYAKITYMLVCMHAGASLSSRPVAPEGEMYNESGFAGDSLSVRLW